MLHAETKETLYASSGDGPTHASVEQNIAREGDGEGIALD